MRRLLLPLFCGALAVTVVFAQKLSPEVRPKVGKRLECEEAGASVSRRLAGRGNALRCCGQSNLRRGIRLMLASLQTRPGRRICRAQTRAAQKEHATWAWSCSSPDHGDRVTSNALNCSTASPVLALSWHCSRTHTPRERLRVPPEKLAYPSALWTSLDDPVDGTTDEYIAAAH